MVPRCDYLDSEVPATVQYNLVFGHAASYPALPGRRQVRNLPVAFPRQCPPSTQVAPIALHCYRSWMSRGPPGPDGPPTAHENFLYLLAEMEASLARGTIPWTADEVQPAKRRVANVFADLDAIATRLRTRACSQ